MTPGSFCSLKKHNNDQLGSGSRRHEFTLQGTVTLLPHGLDQESRTISVVITLSSRSLNVCRQLLCPGCKNIGVLSKTSKRGTGSCRFPASES